MNFSLSGVCRLDFVAVGLQSGARFSNSDAAYILDAVTPQTEKVDLSPLKGIVSSVCIFRKS